MSLSTLCLECGLCCDGTLFLFVRVDPPEQDAVRALGIEVGTKRRAPVMGLPCGKLEGKCCSVYAQRPSGCRRFVCGLGQRLVARQVSLDEARAHVADLHARVARVREVFAVPAGVPAPRTARERIDSTTAQVTEAQLAAFRAMEELRYAVFMPPP